MMIVSIALDALVLSSGASLALAFFPHSISVVGRNVEVRHGLHETCNIRDCLSTRHDRGHTSVTHVAGTKGSWGNWAKQVSQREEQERILNKLSEAENKSDLVFRTGTRDDMFKITRLCIETFRGPFEWWMLPLQLIQEFAFYGQINARLGLVTRNEIKHGMMVAEDTKSRGVVGFLEIGMLPPPTSSEESAIVGDAADGGGMETNARVRTPASADSDDAGPILGKTTDVVYLANVVVDRNQRRRGIGRRMVTSALEVVKQLWPDEEAIYVTVEKGNEIALALYKGIGFELAAVEDDELARRRRRASRVYLRKSLA